MGLDSFMGPKKKTKKSSKKKSTRKKSTKKKSTRKKASKKKTSINKMNETFDDNENPIEEVVESKFIKVNLICTNSKCKYKKNVKRIGGPKEKDLICPKCNAEMKKTKK